MPTDLMHGNLLPLKRNANWFIFFGLIITLLGIAGLGMVVGLTLTSMIYFGVLLLVRGGVELLAAYRSREWAGFFFHLISAAIGAVAGLVMITRPGMAAETITLFLGALFMVEGMMLLFARGDLPLPVVGLDAGQWPDYVCAGPDALAGISVFGHVVYRHSDCI